MVPFGKGAGVASKVLLPGAAVGALQGASEEETSLPKIVGSAAMGMAGAGLLHGAGKAVSGVFKKLPKKIMESVFKEPIKATKAGVKSGTSLGQKALEKGEVGTTEAIYKRALTKTQELEDQLQSKLLNSNATINTTNIRKAVDPMVKELEQAGNHSGAQKILDRLTAIEKASGTEIPLSQANQIKRTIYDEIRRSYGVQGSADTELLKTVGRAFKESIEQRAHKVANINRNLSYYGRIADSMADKIAKTGRNNLVSLTDLVVGTGGASVFGPAGLAGVAVKKGLESTVGQTAIAKGLNAVGNKLPAISPTVYGQVGARIGEQATNLVSSPQTDQPTDNQGGDYGETPGLQDLPPVESVSQPSPQSTITGYTSEQLGKAYTQALLDGKEDVAKQIKALYDTEVSYQSSKNKEEKSLSGPNSVLLNKAQTAIRAVDRIDAVLEKNPGLAMEKALNPLSQEGRLLGQDIVSAIDVLGYFRTGAAITADQRKDYVYMFPSALDSPATVKAKLQRLREEFAGYEQGLLESTGTNELPPITDTSQSNFSKGAVPQTARTAKLPPVIQKFGNYNPKVEKFSPGKKNIGVDLKADVGTDLYAPQGDWVVAETFNRARRRGKLGNSENRGYGNSVLLVNSETGEKLRLSHLSKIAVKRGQAISTGTLIAQSGWTGNASEPHLDLEYYNSKGQLADASKTKYAPYIFSPSRG